MSPDEAREQAETFGRGYDAARVAAMYWRRIPAWRKRFTPWEVRAALDALAQHMKEAR